MEQTTDTNSVSVSSRSSSALAAEAFLESSLDGLDFLWLEITPRCNLNCIHCYAESDMSRVLHGKLSLKDWFSLLEQATRLGCRKVQFIGGEPTLHPDLGKMIGEANRLNFQSIEVYTNGTHFTPALKKVFKDNHVRLALSVYACDADTHDSITGRRGSFERTLSSLRWAIDAGLEVRVGVIEMEANKGQFDRTLARLQMEGVQHVRLDRIRGIGRGAHTVKVESQMAELCGRCWRGKLCVSADGLVFPCVFSRFCPLGEAQEGLDSIIASERLESFRRELRATTIALKNELGSKATTCDPGDCHPNTDPCHPEDCEPV